MSEEEKKDLPAPVVQAPQQQPALPVQFGLIAPGTQIAASVQIEAHKEAVKVASKVMAAQAMPRNLVEVRHFMLERCRDAAFADLAFYQTKRGADPVEGASINLAKELVTVWKHIDFNVIDHGPLFVRDGEGKPEKYTQKEVQVWDIQNNAYAGSRFNVKWWRDTKEGGYSLINKPEQARDVVNAATSKELRNAILSLIPKPFIMELKAACDATLAAYLQNKEKLQAMLQSFSDDFGVGQIAIEKWAGKSVLQLDNADLADLRRVYVAIRDGKEDPADIFGDFEAGVITVLPEPKRKPIGRPTDKSPVAEKPDSKKKEAKPADKPAGKPAEEEPKQPEMTETTDSATSAEDAGTQTAGAATATAGTTGEPAASELQDSRDLWGPAS